MVIRITPSNLSLFICSSSSHHLHHQHIMEFYQVPTTIISRSFPCVCYFYFFFIFITSSSLIGTSDHHFSLTLLSQAISGLLRDIKEVRGRKYEKKKKNKRFFLHNNNNKLDLFFPEIGWIARKKRRIRVSLAFSWFSDELKIAPA